MKIKKFGFNFLHLFVFIFVIFHIFLYVRGAQGVVGPINLSAEGNTFVGPTPGTGGTLPTGKPQYYVVVGYNGSPTPSPIVKSGATECKVATGQNSCTVTWPCTTGATTYRVYYAEAAGSPPASSGVADGTSSVNYLSVSAPTTSVAHTSVGQGGLTGTVPSGTLPIANVVPVGNGQFVNSLVCKFGIGTAPGTPTPPAQLQVGGTFQLDGTGKVRNGATPSAALDYVTKAYADNLCYWKQNSPRLYFNFNEGSGTTAVGTGTHARNGTLTNSATWVTGHNGSYAVNTGSGASTQYVSISGLPLGGNWTIVAWTLFPLPTTSAGWRTMTRGDLDHEVIVQSDGLLGMYNNTAADCSGVGFKSSGYDVDGLASGWHMVAAVGSSSSTTFYIDGVSVGTSSCKSHDNLTAIGNIQSVGEQAWGTIDQFIVYNSALSSTAIASLYNNMGPY